MGEQVVFPGIRHGSTAPGAQLVGHFHQLAEAIKRVTGTEVATIYLDDATFDALDAAEAAFFFCEKTRRFDFMGVAVLPASEAKNGT